MRKRDKNITNKEILLGIWKALDLRRRKQILIINLLILISGFAETFSIATILPLISFLTEPEKTLNNSIANSLILYFGINNKNGLIIPITIILIVSFLFAGLIRTLTLWIISRFSAVVGSDFSFNAYQKNLYQPYSVHISKNSSESIAINSVEINSLVNTITVSLKLILALVYTCFLVFFLLIYDFKLGILSISVFTSCYLLITFFSRVIAYKNSVFISNSRRKQIKFLSESFGSIKDIILNNNHKFYLSIFSNIDKKMRMKMSSNVFIATFPRVIIECIAFIYIALLSLYIVLTSGNNILILSKFGVIAVTCQKLLPQLQQIYSSFTRIRGGAKSTIRVLDSVNQQFSNIQGTHNKSIEFHDLINLQNIYFKYQDTKKEILKGLDLKINKSERIGIIGETGSGKTTLLDLLVGLLNPTKGLITIDKFEITNFEDLLLWRSKIAYIPQQIYLSDSSILENIACGLKIEDIDIDKVIVSAKRAKIHDFIIKLPNGYKTNIGEMGIRLSGGQRQRIGIARAFFNIENSNKNVLILDEATSSLDEKVEEQVIDSLYSIKKDITVIMVAHRYTTLYKCDRIIELKNGVIKSQGGPKKFFKYKL